jgi:hypothetical protein
MRRFVGLPSATGVGRQRPAPRLHPPRVARPAAAVSARHRGLPHQPRARARRKPWHWPWKWPDRRRARCPDRLNDAAVPAGSRSVRSAANGMGAGRSPCARAAGWRQGTRRLESAQRWRRPWRLRWQAAAPWDWGPRAPAARGLAAPQQADDSGHQHAGKGAGGAQPPGGTPRPPVAAGGGGARWTVGRRAVGGSQDLCAQLAGRLHFGIGRVAQSLAQVGVGRIELHAFGAVAGR